MTDNPECTEMRISRLFAECKRKTSEMCISALVRPAKSFTEALSSAFWCKFCALIRVREWEGKGKNEINKMNAAHNTVSSDIISYYTNE